MVDLGMNDVLHIEEADDGPYFVLWPLGPGMHWGSMYRVMIEQQEGNTWRATVPQMPHIEAIAPSRQAVKTELARKIRNDLRERLRYIEGAAPLVKEYIGTPTNNGSSRDAVIRGDNLPVWQVIDGMDDAFIASARGDDTIIMDRTQIGEAARQFGIDIETVRAAVGYYLQHRAEIRQRIIEERGARLDETFKQIADAHGLSEDELADLLGTPSHDAA